MATACFSITPALSGIVYLVVGRISANEPRYATRRIITTTRALSAVANDDSTDTYRVPVTEISHCRLFLAPSGWSYAAAQVPRSPLGIYVVCSSRYMCIRVCHHSFRRICKYSVLRFTCCSRSTPQEPPQPRAPLLYSTLTHTVPLLVLFTLIAAILSYLHLLLLRVSVQPVLMGTSVAVPAIMLFAAIYAFAASFFWIGKDSGWAETIGYVDPPTRPCS